MVFHPQAIPWHVVIFNNNDETQFIASMNFTGELYTAYINNPFSPEHARYYYKHTDTDSIYYLSPEASVISPDLLNKYGAQLLLDVPDITEFEEHKL
ncbi:hypothetical protein [Tolumonas lignilytica]|jgi:hypothetical protein|uniref:hypothetical protein n=1 Tax=Tolumonas lignilytica TaxID=1283284 RepID=UPI000464465B|nr:hypothetical protein [Tolumonas lignilytica]